MTSISIIIPVINEADIIRHLLKHLKTKSTTNHIKEIIVIDGGSDDNTSIIAKEEGAIVLQSKQGRAIQMNVGTQDAQGDILYFLHADSFPPKGYDDFILQEIKKGHNAGCFRMQFDSNHWWLQLAGWLTKFKWKACRGGDQSLFISKQLFRELNGFDERYTIYEDIDLINKLYKRNTFTIIPHWLTTSARRYRKNGIWTLQYHFWAIYVKKWFGASANDLEIYYNKHIS